MLLAERGTEDSLTGGSVAFAEDLDFKSSSLVKRARRVNNVADASINLEEQNNDDVERIARRRSRLLEPHPDVVNSPAHDAARRAAAAHFMPRAQVGEHYGNCIRLAAENKITYKNAFDLHLIDFMGEMIKKEDFTSFRMASSSLDASAKIYAGRVDAVHQETYKVLTGLGRSDSKSAKADDGADEPQAPADGDESIDDLGGASERKRKERKRAANSKNVIVTGLSKIRSRIKASDGDVDPLFQQQAAAYDDGGTVELQLNRLRTHSKFSELLQDSNTPLFRPRSEVDSLTCCTRLLEVPQPFDSHTLEASLCLAFDNFHFNKSDDDVSSQLAPLSPLFVSEAGDSGSVTPVPQASPPLMEIDDDDNPLPLPDADPDAVVVIGSSNAAVRFAEKNDVVAVPASDRSPTEAANGEGEMFVTSLKTMLTNHIENFGHVNDGVLGLWAGPEHWRKKAKRRRLDEFGNVAAPVEDVENVIEVGKSSRAKVTKIKRLNIDYAPALIDAGENQSKSGCLVRSDWSKQLEAYTKKSGKSPVLREQNRRQASERFNLLPPSITGARQNIYELCNRVVMTNLTDKKTDEARENATASAMAGGGIVPPWLDSQAADAAEGVPQDGEADDVGHLQNVDDDYDDDDDDIAPYDGIFTQGNENAPAATVVEGDGSVELVAPPRQIARLEIGYARSAKLINVRHLKGVLWAMLEDRLLSVASALDQVSPAKKTRTSEAVSSGQGDEESGDPAKSSLTASSFNDLLTSLPAKVSKQTAGELSVAIGLNCLLHLANEKDLFLETNDDFTDIRISQGLSASELELLSSYQQRSAQAGLRPKKQLSLDPWLDRSDEEDV